MDIRQELIGPLARQNDEIGNTRNQDRRIDATLGNESHTELNFFLSKSDLEVRPGNGSKIGHRPSNSRNRP